jgi:hypothetical protein
MVIRLPKEARRRHIDRGMQFERSGQFEQKTFKQISFSFSFLFLLKMKKKMKKGALGFC